MIIKTIINKIFKKLVKEIFDEIKKLTDEVNENDLIYYFKSNASEKHLMISIMVFNL